MSSTQLGANYSVIPSTFRIDALVEDKSLASVVNGNHHQQHSNEEQHQQNTSSPFNPFSHQDPHQQHSPSGGDCHQLPPPLDPVETRVTR